MRLSDITRQTKSNRQSGGTATLDEQALGTIRHAVAYPQPIYALLNGRPVTVLATGDVVGMSPALQFVDEEGRIDWASSDDFEIDDRHVLPQPTSRTPRNLERENPTRSNR